MAFRVTEEAKSAVYAVFVQACTMLVLALLTGQALQRNDLALGVLLAFAAGTLGGGLGPAVWRHEPTMSI